MNSAMYAAGPRSCTCDLLLADWTRSRLGFDVVRRIPLLTALIALLAGCGGEQRGAARALRPARARLPAQRRARRHLHGVGTEPTRRLIVRVRPPRPTRSSCCAAGRADMAVVDIHDLGLARERGEDIVGVGRARPAPAGGRDRPAGDRAPARPRGQARRRHRAALRRRRAARGRRARRRRLRRGPAHHDRLLRRAEPDRRARSTRSSRSGTPRAWRCAQRGVRTREFRVDDYGAPRYPELVLAVRRADAAARAGPTSRRRSPACATARRARCATAPATIDAARRGPRAPTRTLVRAQLDAVAPALRAADRASTARALERLGALRRALRDPRAAARRRPRRSRSRCGRAQRAADRRRGDQVAQPSARAA